MSATFLPSIDNRMERSVPKFGTRCTITRPVGCPLLDGVGVGVARLLAFASATQTKIAHASATPTKRLVRKFMSQFIRPGVLRQALRGILHPPSSASPARTILHPSAFLLTGTPARSWRAHCCL